MYISKFVPVGVCGKHREPAFVGYSLVSLPFIAHDIHTHKYRNRSRNTVAVFAILCNHRTVVFRHIMPPSMPRFFPFYYPFTMTRCVPVCIWWVFFRSAS